MGENNYSRAFSDWAAGMRTTELELTHTSDLLEYHGMRGQVQNNFSQRMNFRYTPQSFSDADCPEGYVSVDGKCVQRLIWWWI